LNKNTTIVSILLANLIM